MEELRTAKTPIVKGNALELLKAMQRHFVYGETKAALNDLLQQNIYDFESNTPENRHYAINAWFNFFGKMKEGEALKMVENFFDSEHAIERSSAYVIIEKQDLQVQFMERLIGRIRHLRDQEWKKKHKDGSRDEWDIESCFKKSNSEVVLVSFFRNLFH